MSRRVALERWLHVRVAQKGEEFLPECCVPTVQHPVSVMVWGAMAFNSIGSIRKVEGRLNTIGYQEILANKMLPDAYALIGGDFILQQDNATICARST